jgi:predicted aldo/keto reductase-like oxidoreductase
MGTGIGVLNGSLIGTITPQSIPHHLLKFFDQAKVSGKIRACGFSVHNNHLESIETASDNPFFDVVMMPYNHKGSYIHSVSGRFSKWDQPKLERLLKKLHKKRLESSL